MKDEYDIGRGLTQPIIHLADDPDLFQQVGDKVLFGVKMKTLCDSVIVGNPEKTPSVEMLFTPKSIASRMTWPTVMAVGKVKRGPRKGKRTMVCVTSNHRSMTRQLLSGQRKAIKQRLNEERLLGFDPGTGDIHIATFRG